MRVVQSWNIYYNAQLLYDDRGFAVHLTEPNETWTLWTASRFGLGEEEGYGAFRVGGAR